MKPRKNLLKLSIGAVGIVFGDIGTSPLYALRECLAPGHGLAPTQSNIVGVVSLILWVLTLIVCIKYLIFVLRADNRGEGGVLALISLVGSKLKKNHKASFTIVAFLGIIGASLLYSDGILTPAVSVLSAVEGLKIITPAFDPWIVPAALVILVILFLFQFKGTAKVAGLFGPILIIWFLTLAILGVGSIIKAPLILKALNPWEAIHFVLTNGFGTFLILGSVFLAITGAEMLYADMGHFGRGAIRISWFSLVYPALILNYLGQGAFLLVNPGRTDNLFFQLAPSWFQYPLVFLATAATVVASQAVISGDFSLARQSVQLGFWPRMQVRHTSDETIGQVYVPFINWFLMMGTVILVLVFRESSKLANAYGIAVSADMLMTTFLMLFVAKRIWKIPLPVLLLPALIFLIVDINFFVANSGKVFAGGWVVVAMAFAIFILMKTWRDGRTVLRKSVESKILSVADFAKSIMESPPVRVQRTAVFLAGNPFGIPTALLHNLKHNQVLHSQTFIVSVQTDESPKVSAENRAAVKDYGNGIWHIILHFGFSETPDIPKVLSTIKASGYHFDPVRTTYFLGRESLVVTSKHRTMSHWRKKLFGFMSHNALAATSFFHLPVNQVVEISAQTEL